MCSGVSEDSTRAPWRRCRSDWLKSCAATRPRHRVRRRHGFLVSRTTSARRAHRSRSDTCVRERCLEPTTFRWARSTGSGPPAERQASSAGDVADRTGSRPALSAGSRACQLPDSTATCARFQFVVGWCADSSFRIHEAMSVLSEWNARCQPPWSERELLVKVQNARKYGREPLGSLARQPRMSATRTLCSYTQLRNTLPMYF